MRIDGGLGRDCAVRIFSERCNGRARTGLDKEIRSVADARLADSDTRRGRDWRRRDRRGCNGFSWRRDFEIVRPYRRQSGRRCATRRVDWRAVGTNDIVLDPRQPVDELFEQRMHATQSRLDATLGGFLSRAQVFKVENRKPAAFAALRHRGLRGADRFAHLVELGRELADLIAQRAETFRGAAAAHLFKLVFKTAEQAFNGANIGRGLDSRFDFARERLSRLVDKRRFKSWRGGLRQFDVDRAERIFERLGVDARRLDAVELRGELAHPAFERLGVEGYRSRGLQLFADLPHPSLKRRFVEARGLRVLQLGGKIADRIFEMTGVDRDWPS